MLRIDPLIEKMDRENRELDRLIMEDEEHYYQTHSLGVAKFTDAAVGITKGAIAGWLFAILVPIGLFIYLVAYHYFGWHISDELATKISGWVLVWIICMVISWFGSIGRMLGWGFFLLFTFGNIVPLIF